MGKNDQIMYKFQPKRKELLVMREQKV